MLFIPNKNDEHRNLTGHTLILPSVCVGNVGQLAVDLLITNLPTKKIGIVHHPAIYPLVGGDPYDPNSNDVVTSADLHLVSHCSLVIMQIRAPLIKSERDSLLSELVSWCKSVGIHDIVMLASCNACERWDYNQITGSQLRYLTSKVPQKDVEILKSIGASEMEERTDEFGMKHRFLSGAGFVKQFMDTCDLPMTTLFKFVDEGDNTNDAIVLINFLDAWKKLSQITNPTWKAPFSWKNMFGGPAPNSIY
ncbi:proteasome assembly chaperone 2-like [Homarus americanus]|uniref:proteasome assembly chaperone 2-like n=1 Tax=Homarus americanus TaxID=6706 RepID=UPI001C48639C|nr:proteasome assembly chaperone 2-like [Homarus americanus]